MLLTLTRPTEQIDNDQLARIARGDSDMYALLVTTDSVRVVIDRGDGNRWYWKLNAYGEALLPAQRTFAWPRPPNKWKPS
jgi:hypothetical protein